VDDAREPALHAEVQRRSARKYGWGDGLVVAIAPDDGAGPPAGA
jgi:hypothetical protein